MKQLFNKCFTIWGFILQKICSEKSCAGCGACVDVCPKNAIKIIDSLKYNNAVIDNTLCVDCKACYNVCQNNNDIHFMKPILWYQGWSKNELIRSASSSGGAATELIRTFLEEYGSVCSCVFKNGEFVFEFADTNDDYKKFRGSKYVKSNPKNIYKKIKLKLLNGEKVLFIGLPCQVQAVKMFVGDKYNDNLYTVDLICHGTPSSVFLEKYLNNHKLSLVNLNNLSFRKNNKFHLYNDYIGIEHERVSDEYTYAFLNGLNYTENCYNCKYARIDRVSDITIGDSWGSTLPLDEQNKGISLMLCQTEKGKKLIRKTNMYLTDVDLKIAIENNKQLIHPSYMPKERELFFGYYTDNGNFSKSVEKCYPKFFLKQKVKKVLIKSHLITDKKI